MGLGWMSQVTDRSCGSCTTADVNNIPSRPPLCALLTAWHRDTLTWGWRSSGPRVSKDIQLRQTEYTSTLLSENVAPSSKPPLAGAGTLLVQEFLWGCHQLNRTKSSAKPPFEFIDAFHMALSIPRQPTAPTVRLDQSLSLNFTPTPGFSGLHCGSSHFCPLKAPLFPSKL